MKQILFAYDGSHTAESALGDLPRMGLAKDAAICVLVVVPEGASAEQLGKAEKQTEHATQVIRGLLPQVTLDSMIVAGQPAEQILREAGEQKSELIVIGAHGKSAVERFFFGSVSTKVAAEAPCAVRICRHHREPGFQHLRLTLAVDGSQGSELAIASVLGRVWPQGTAFHVASVVESGHEAHTPSLQQMVNKVAKLIIDAGFLAVPVLLEGNPAKALVKHSESWAPHCIILGSRGIDHGETRKLGTLATAMVNQVECEVEVIR